MIIRNKTALDIPLDDLGGITIPASADFQSNSGIDAELPYSIDFNNAVNNGSLVVVIEGVELSQNDTLGISTASVGEPYLNNPSSDGLVLSSLANGTRSWMDLNGRPVIPRSFTLGTKPIGNLGEIGFLTGSQTPVYWDSTTAEWKFFNNTTAPGAPRGGGLAGTYIELFEDLAVIPTNWSITPALSATYGTSTAGEWNVINTVTRSNGTGNVTPVFGANYIYAEVSGGGNASVFELSTTNFSVASSIEVVYNLEGTATGTFDVLYDNGVSWVAISSINTALAGWRTLNLDLTPYDIYGLRIRYSGATDWSGDFCVDKITILST